MNSQAGSNQLVEEMLTHLKPPIPVVDQHDDSKVAAFYANRSVFITGATGFIGKALVEKLLRSCPRIKRIYILMREKRGHSIQERLSQLIRAQCFDKIREAHEGSSHVLEEKLCPIQGDITQPKFGITFENMEELSRECTIVINSAATIRFMEPIDNAVKNNIYSVGQLIEFCNEITHLQALIHLSTAYSNCHKYDIINEIFYTPPMPGDVIQAGVKVLRNMHDIIYVNPELTTESRDILTMTDDLHHPDRSACKPTPFYDDSKQEPIYDILDRFTKFALRLTNRPNTYTFTKAISESYLLDKANERKDRYLYDKIPIAIVRPSIVGGAWREPTVAWVDNYNGPTGAMMSLYTGALQAMPGVGEGVADIVPVDMLTNMVLSTGWFLVEKSSLVSKVRPAGENGMTTPFKRANKHIVYERRRDIRQDLGFYIFNFVSGKRNPIRWHLVTDLIRELAYKYPSKHLMRLPASYFVPAGKLYYWYDLINQKWPAYIIDFIRSWVCLHRVDNNTSAVRSYNRIKQVTDTLTPFTSNQWQFRDINTRVLYESLDDIDKQVFPFDVASINWYEYIRAYIIGSRIYLMRDEAKNVPAALKQLQRRRAFYWLGVGSLILIIISALIHYLF